MVWLDQLNILKCYWYKDVQILDNLKKLYCEARGAGFYFREIARRVDRSWYTVLLCCQAWFGEYQTQRILAFRNHFQASRSVCDELFHAVGRPATYTNRPPHHNSYCSCQMAFNRKTKISSSRILVTYWRPSYIPRQKLDSSEKITECYFWFQLVFRCIFKSCFSMLKVRMYPKRMTQQSVFKKHETIYHQRPLMFENEF